MAGCPFSTRRSFLQAGGAVAAAGTVSRAQALGFSAPTDNIVVSRSSSGEPFFGRHQAGIVTPQQAHLVFASFDLATGDASRLAKLFRIWTSGAERLVTGRSVGEPVRGDQPTPDNGEFESATASRLTLTFGFGPGLFEKDGQDRFGLAKYRPAALQELPRFVGDQLLPQYCGGDLCIQACADDRFVAFHAVRQLARLAGGADNYSDTQPFASLRWLQSGFIPSNNGGAVRNLLGFKDGTQNPGMDRQAEKANGVLVDDGKLESVWSSHEGPDWMDGGTYMVMRRIRLALEHWDRTDLDFQEQVIGRRKQSGAPLTGGDEFAPLDLDATDRDGNLVIGANAHVRLGAASRNGGARILRRGYSYFDGLNFVAERWPPWHQGLEYDAGLLFICFQRDPRTGFIRIFDSMSKMDLLNQYATHVGSALFACPAGIQQGEYLGQRLLSRVL